MSWQLHCRGTHNILIQLRHHFLRKSCLRVLNDCSYRDIKLVIKWVPYLINRIVIDTHPLQNCIEGISLLKNLIFLISIGTCLMLEIRYFKRYIIIRCNIFFTLCTSYVTTHTLIYSRYKFPWSKAYSYVSKLNIFSHFPVVNILVDAIGV